MEQETTTIQDTLAYIKSFVPKPQPTTVEDLIAENERLKSELSVMRNRERKDYFAGCTTVVEVKTRYLQLAYEFNFYSGGDEQTTKLINEQYGKACDPLIMNEPISEDDLLEQLERGRWYIDVVAILPTLPGIKIDVVDNFLWVSGDYQSGKVLMETGFRYIREKQAWYYRL